VTFDIGGAGLQIVGIFAQACDYIGDAIPLGVLRLQISAEAHCSAPRFAAHASRSVMR
jgi:hypothetical protein